MNALTIMQQLKEPFSPRHIHWRTGSTTKDKKSCIPLAYIDARHVMGRLDQVLTPFCWQDTYSAEQPRAVRKTDRFTKENWNEQIPGRVTCGIGILFDGQWIWKYDGAGETNVEGEKGGMSDAFKRAAVKWGIGRYLYAMGSDIWVGLDGRNNPVMQSFTSPSGKQYQAPYALPEFALPDSWKAAGASGDEQS